MFTTMTTVKGLHRGPFDSAEVRTCLLDYHAATWLRSLAGHHAMIEEDAMIRRTLGRAAL